MTNNTSGLAGTSADINGAKALHEYISRRYLRFTLQQAIEVVGELHPTDLEDLKSLAKRLRPALNRRGVAVGHSNALEAASRVLRGIPWQEARRTQTAAGLNVYTMPDAQKRTFSS